ncbi:MAG: RES family NAD+ phosphorylase [Gemmatimonadales bacterium]|nr:RES family NAD+ phosphorylase [Gemmatimonadales bacterium]
MLTLWRIGSDTPDYAADDLAGVGAERSGGRWNRKGTRMVYASTSRALACLETLAHLGSGDLPLNRYLAAVTLTSDDWVARTVFDSATHVGWDAEPPGLVSLDWGNRWSTGRSSLLAEVPSVIVPEESNVLINPLHPAATTLVSRKIRRWAYDARLRSV